MQSSTAMAMIFLMNSLQLGSDANSTALRTALLQWCYYSRNIGAFPAGSAGNGTGADDDNGMRRLSQERQRKDKG